MRCCRTSSRRAVSSDEVPFATLPASSSLESSPRSDQAESISLSAVLSLAGVTCMASVKLTAEKEGETGKEMMRCVFEVGEEKLSCLTIGVEGREMRTPVVSVPASEPALPVVWATVTTCWNASRPPGESDMGLLTRLKWMSACINAVSWMPVAPWLGIAAVTKSVYGEGTVGGCAKQAGSDAREDGPASNRSTRGGAFAWR